MRAAVDSDACAWHARVSVFLEATADDRRGAHGDSDLLASLTAHYYRCMNMGPDAGQVSAWRHEIAVLRRSLADVATRVPRARHWEIIFEYELPRERGRRPDVVILTGSQVMVLEFKDAAAPQQAHIDQVAAYARDLSEYHAASHDKLIDPVLVMTLSNEPARVVGEEGRGATSAAEPSAAAAAAAIHGSAAPGIAAGVQGAPRSGRDPVTITGPGDLARVLIELERRSPAEPIDAAAWLDADYSPLPSLVTAARRIFDHEPLPHIRRAHSAGIPQTLAYLTAIAEEARATGGLHLALVTGVSGSGKTLVGLQFVYQTHFDDSWGGRQQAVFLSGNGPLVQVLQYALQSRVFVQDVHGFLKQYGGGRTRVPQEHIWVYDEAQRAWDATQVQEKRGHPTSEPEDFLRIGARKSWALMVGLIGEGQEIHVGEEAGLAQWNEAIARMPDPWVVHCPAKIAHVFRDAAAIDTSPHLDLTVSLRTHLAEDVQYWVASLLEGRLDEAADLATRVRRQGFDLYLTSSRDQAEAYVRERYRGQEEARYGLLASSKARLSDYGIYAEWQATRRLRVGPWFNDAPEKPLSCCRC